MPQIDLGSGEEHLLKVTIGQETIDLDILLARDHLASAHNEKRLGSAVEYYNTMKGLLVELGLPPLSYKNVLAVTKTIFQYDTDSKNGQAAGGDEPRPDSQQDTVPPS